MEVADTSIIYRAIPPALRISPTDKRLLKAFACDLSTHILDNRPFTCLITTDKTLHRLNWQWRAQDKPTDVLSFPSEAVAQLPADALEGLPSAGDLAISIERADAQASVFQHELFEEIQVLMLHGVLHLAGMDHEQDKGEMAKAEMRWRRAFNLPLGLLTRRHPLANLTETVRQMRASS